MEPDEAPDPEVAPRGQGDFIEMFWILLPEGEPGAGFMVTT